MIELEEVLKNKIKYNILSNDKEYTYLIFLIKDDKIVYITHSQKGEQYLTNIKNKDFDSYFIKKMLVKKDNFDCCAWGDLVANLIFKYQPSYNDILRFRSNFACKKTITNEIKDYDLRDIIPTIVRFKKEFVKHGGKLFYLHKKLYVDILQLMDFLEIMDKIKKDKKNDL